MSPKSFLVTGATSGVGAYLTSMLLDKGHTVHALVRTPTSDASVAIQKAGAKLFKGSFDEPDAIAAAAQGCDGLFLNPSPSLSDPDMEPRHGANVIGAAKKAGVKSCVYFSVNGAGDEASWPSWVMQGPMAGYWRGKSILQQSVRDASFPDGYTILQPATFMSNFANDGHISMLYPSVKDKPIGRLDHAVKPNTKIALIDPLDIAKFAAAALLDPKAYDRKEIPLAGQMLTLGEIADAMTRASGKEIRADHADQSQRDANPIVSIAVWIDEIGPTLDFSDCQRYGIDFGTLDRYFERERDVLKSTLEV